MKQWLEMREKYNALWIFQTIQKLDCVNFEMLTSVISDAIYLVG